MTFALVCMSSILDLGAEGSDWYKDAPPWEQFSGAYLLFMIGYSIAQSMVFVDFYQTFGRSKHLGLYVGLLSSVGSAGRVVGPLVAVGLYSLNTGGLTLMLTNAGLVGLGALATLVAVVRTD